jgi:signal transduction histidine kinase/membrane protein implicated in regulation of membrane protease activity
MDGLAQRLSFIPRAAAGRTWPRALTVAAVVAVGYYFGALVGFALRFPSSGISFFWPPTAVLTAALLLSPPGTWAALLVGAFAGHAAAHAQNGVPIAAWPIQFLANAAQALLSAYLVRRYSDPRRPFGDLRRASAYIVGACIVAPCAASLVSAYVYVRLGWATDFGSAWGARTVSNAIASLTLVPPILMIWPYPGTRFAPPRARRALEFLVLLMALVGAHLIVRQLDNRTALSMSLALYAPAPFLLWATVRFGGLGLSFTLLATAVLTIGGALRGDGAFASETPLEAIVGVQFFVAVTAVPMILIAGLLSQTKNEHLALLEMERQNSATLRAIPDLMFVQARDGTFLQHYARDEGALLVPPEAFLGRNMREILPPELAERFDSAFRTVTADAPSVVEYTLPMHGAVREYEARIIGLDRNRVLTLVRDITARRQAEDALKHANDALVRMGRVSALAELTATIAHELNQPLAAIVSNANACQRWIAAGSPDADLHGALKDVVADSLRASQIVRRTKEMFSNQPVQTTAVDLNEVVRDVIELAEARLRKADVQLETDLDSGVPAVEADVVQIKQIVLNLVLNAVDAMADVRDRARVLRITTARAGRGATITARDTGTGFRSEDAERLFEAFYTTKADGIGVGLAISRSIAEAHGGTLRAEANPSGGATFRLTLPANG